MQVGTWGEALALLLISFKHVSAVLGTSGVSCVHGGVKQQGLGYLCQMIVGFECCYGCLTGICKSTPRLSITCGRELSAVSPCLATGSWTSLRRTLCSYVALVPLLAHCGRVGVPLQPWDCALDGQLVASKA